MFLFGCVMTIYFAMSEKNNKKTYYFIKISTANFRAGKVLGKQIMPVL